MVVHGIIGRSVNGVFKLFLLFFTATLVWLIHLKHEPGSSTGVLPGLLFMGLIFMLTVKILLGD